MTSSAASDTDSAVTPAERQPQVLVLLSLPPPHFRPDGNYTAGYADAAGAFSGVEDIFHEPGDHSVSSAVNAFHTITACKAPCNRTTGIAYPLLVTGISSVAMPAQAGGSLLDLGIYNLAMTQWVLQQALGYSPLEAGASIFPITVIMLAFSARAGSLAQRIGPRWPMTTGPLVIAGG